MISQKTLVLLGGLAITPNAALAHVGNAASASLLDSLLHPFLGIDHILGSALVVLLTLKRHGAIAWLPAALFGSAIALGFLIGLLGFGFESAQYVSWAIMGVMGLSFLKPRCIMPIACLASVAFLGLSLGNAHSLMAPIPDPTQCLCGLALALGTLLVAAILALPLSLLYRKYAELNPQTCQ